MTQPIPTKNPDVGLWGNPTESAFVTVQVLSLSSWERAGRGKRFSDNTSAHSPHPALRATFSQEEKENLSLSSETMVGLNGYAPS